MYAIRSYYDLIKAEPKLPAPTKKASVTLSQPKKCSIFLIASLVVKPIRGLPSAPVEAISLRTTIGSMFNSWARKVVETVSTSCFSRSFKIRKY